MRDENPDQPWRWWPSWNDNRSRGLRFVGSTDRFDVFYDTQDDDYSLVYEADPTMPFDPVYDINFHIVEVDENGVIEIGRRPPEGLDPLNMCQLYQLLEDSKEVKND